MDWKVNSSLVLLCVLPTVTPSFILIWAFKCPQLRVIEWWTDKELARQICWYERGGEHGVLRAYRVIWLLSLDWQRNVSSNQKHFIDLLTTRKSGLVNCNDNKTGLLLGISKWNNILLITIRLLHLILLSNHCSEEKMSLTEQTFTSDWNDVANDFCQRPCSTVGYMLLVAVTSSCSLDQPSSLLQDQLFLSISLLHIFAYYSWVLHRWCS